MPSGSVVADAVGSPPPAGSPEPDVTSATSASSASSAASDPSPSSHSGKHSGTAGELSPDSADSGTVVGAAGSVDAAGSPEPESSASRPSSAHGGRHRGTTGATSLVSVDTSGDGGASDGSASSKPGGQSVGATVGSPSPEAKTGALTRRAATRPPTTIPTFGARRLLNIAQTVASGRHGRGSNSGVRVSRDCGAQTTPTSASRSVPCFICSRSATSSAIAPFR